MKVDISKIFEISARVSGALTIASSLLLFLPEQWLPFNIGELRDNYGIWIFVAFIICISIWGSYLIEWVRKTIKNKLIKKSNSKVRIKLLNNLSDGERNIIADMYFSKDRTKDLDIRDALTGQMTAKQIIGRGSNMSSRGFDFSYFLQHWVIECIDKNKSLKMELKKLSEENLKD